MCPFVLSELNLLAINLSLLLGFNDEFVLVLHLGTLSSYLNHLIQVRNLDWKRLLNRTL